MSDETQAQANMPPIAVTAQYVKDLSFESPNVPGIFTSMATEQPSITVNVDTNATPLDGGLFEVVLHVQVEAKVKDSTAFLLEVEYAGQFAINIPDEHRSPALLIECPRLLFPFVRNIICDMTRDGGFAPLMLQPIDFVALYQQRVAQLQAAQAEAGEEAEKSEAGE